MMNGNSNDTSTHRRFAAALFLAGAALLLLGNMVHPVDSAPTATSRLDLATSWTWMSIHLTLASAIILLVGATVVLERTFVTPRARRYARIATVTSLLGGGLLATVFGALDGFAVSKLSSHWHAPAADLGAIEPAALALEAIDSGMAALGAFSFLGLTLLALSAALLLSRIVPPAIGWTGTLVGLGGMITGIVLLTVGMTPATLNLMFRPVALAATLYFVVLGFALLSSRPSEAAVPGTPGVVRGNS